MPNMRHFSDEQLRNMARGGSHDVSPEAPWRLDTYIDLMVDGVQTGFRDNMLLGTREQMQAAEDIAYGTFQFLLDKKLIVGYAILLLPLNYNGKDFRNPPFGYGLPLPTIEEVEEELAKRGL